MKEKIKKIFVQLTSYLPDKSYLRIVYFFKMKKILHINNPKTYNEKLQYLKLKQKGKKFIICSDKYSVRNFIKEKIGEKYLIPLLWVGTNPKKIPFEKLPKSFVIKCNHASGFNIIVSDKNNINKKEIIKKLEKWMKEDFWKRGREYNYKGINKKIIIEEYLGKNINDYKFLCFSGNPEVFFIATDRGIDTKFNFFDMNFNKLKIQQGYKTNKKELERPKKLTEMINISKKLAKNFPHVRVDLYEINNKIYFGELTFYHFSGWTKVNPEIIDKKLGKLIK